MARRKRKETNKGAIWMGVFVIVIMIASTLAFVFNDTQGSGSPKYNGYDIRVNSQNNRFILELEDTVHSFYYHPTELELYEYDSSITQLLLSSPVLTISFDPTVEPELLAYQDLFRLELAQSIPKPFVSGITMESDDYDIPVLNCGNSTIQQPIIVLNNSLQTGIVKDGTCVIVNARGLKLLRMKDLLTYRLLGVMDG